MILPSKRLLLPSMVLLVGTVFGAIAAHAFADDLFKNIADDPFKNIGGIDDHRIPVGFVDKITVFPYYPH